ACDENSFPRAPFMVLEATLGRWRSRLDLPSRSTVDDGGQRRREPQSLVGMRASCTEGHRGFDSRCWLVGPRVTRRAAPRPTAPPGMLGPADEPRLHPRDAGSVLLADPAGVALARKSAAAGRVVDVEEAGHARELRTLVSPLRRVADLAREDTSVSTALTRT